MHKSKYMQIALAVCFASLSLSVQSAGLGKLTVISGLGEPLSAEIDLVSATPDELSSLTASIAPFEAYAIQGIERTSIHNAIKIDVISKPDGGAMLKLTTHQPVEDPFLDMLIQVDWATGRLLREYTVLLDPPDYRDPQPGLTSSLDQSVESALPASIFPIQSQASESAPKVAQLSIPEPEADKTLTTKSGDTLNKIARELQIEGYSLDQMLVGIYRANKQAFASQNMHRLKAGQLIKAPRIDELSGITHSEAREEIRLQTSDWNAYRHKLAELAVASAPAAESEVNASASGKLRAATEDKSMPVETGPRDVVKLSKIEPDAASQADELKTLREKLNTTQEESIAREHSVREADERTAMLEKQVADLQALLAIKNQLMAELQKNATVPDANTASVEGSPDGPAAAQQSLPVPDAVTKAKPATNKKSVQRFEPLEGTGLLHDLRQNSPFLAIAAGTLVLLGGTWLYLRNRRKRNRDNFERGILTAGGLRANTVFGNTSGSRVETGDTTFLTDFSQTSDAMIDTHEVDPIAEAEVYMAYGRDSQAEEILNDAIKKDPKRYELHLKLLEIFAGRRDISAFEVVAGELYSTLGAEDPVWFKVVEMGTRLEPSNPLYDLSKLQNPAQYAPHAAIAAAVASEATQTAERQAEGNATLAEARTAETDVAESSDTGQDLLDSALEFSLDALDKDASPETSVGNPAAETQVEQEADTSLDFELVAEAGDVTPEIAQAADESMLLPELQPIMKPDEQSAEPEWSTGDSFPELELPPLNIEPEEPAASAAENVELAGLPEAREDASDHAVRFEQTGEQFADEQDISDMDLSLDTLANETTKLKALQEQAENAPDAQEQGLQPAGIELDLSGISLELDTEEAEPETIEIKTPEQEPDEVDTKLDLVTAYLDMGDHEGARELIEEVMKEGSAAQREHAQALLNRLA